MLKNSFIAIHPDADWTFGSSLLSFSPSPPSVLT